MLPDTGPDKKSLQSLMLWKMNGWFTRDSFGRLTLSAANSACDLYLRWSRVERQVCFDSVHGGTRQVYVMDVPRDVAT